MKRNQRSTTMTDQNGFSQYTPVQIWSPRNEMQIEWKVSCVCYVYVCKYVDFEFNNILQINSTECVLFALCYSFAESCIGQLGKRGTSNRSVFSWWNLKRMKLPIIYGRSAANTNDTMSTIDASTLDIPWHLNRKLAWEFWI